MIDRGIDVLIEGKRDRWMSAGGNGYINDYPTGRYLRDAKLYEIGAGTSEVRRLVIGRALNAEYNVKEKK